MKIAPFDETAFHQDHPAGTVSFNYLLMGDAPESLENYRYILGRQDADFYMPRHRHTFEQLRLPLVGDMNLGEQGILYEGEIGYFSEGMTYGPQDDPLIDAKPGERLQLVLQFGGASGLGTGLGGGPAARRPEGERQCERRAIKFPRPRYNSVIILSPAHFNWLPVLGVAGVERKYFGAFTERAFWIEMIKIGAGAEWLSTSEGARRLSVVLSGAATVNGTEIGRLTAIQADAGETLHVSAIEETVLYIVGLPPVQLPSTPSDQFDVIESHVVIQQSQPIAAAIQFENPNASRSTVPTARIGEERKRSFKWRHSMKNALFPALLAIFAAVAATPAAAQRSHAFNPNMSLSAPATSPLQQQQQADYASQLQALQRALLQQNPSGVTPPELSISRALNSYTPK
jgi:hypothetical protein